MFIAVFLGSSRNNNSLPRKIARYKKFLKVSKAETSPFKNLS